MLRAALLFEGREGLSSRSDRSLDLTAPPRHVADRVQRAAEQDPAPALLAKNGQRLRELVIRLLEPAGLGEHTAREQANVADVDRRSAFLLADEHDGLAAVPFRFGEAASLRLERRKNRVPL